MMTFVAHLTSTKLAVSVALLLPFQCSTLLFRLTSTIILKVVPNAIVQVILNPICMQTRMEML